MTDDLDVLGPIDYLVVEFPAGHRVGDGLPLLVDLVEQGTIRILDLIFVSKGPDGSISGVAIADLDGDGELDLAVFEGASSGLLNSDDVADVGAVLDHGSSAAILVYENLWAAPLAASLRRRGARLVSGGRIPHADVLAALDDLELADTGPR